MSGKIKGKRRGVEEIGGIIDQARETMVSPHIFLRLENRTGELVSQVNGVLANQDERDGLLLTPAAIGDVQAFLPVCRQNPEKRGRILLNIARNFLGLELKTLPTKPTAGKGR